jgi:rhodanese-related sulfurtransferase
MGPGFSSRLGALLLGGAGAAYLAGALATGHSARSEAPLALVPGAVETSLDVWKAGVLMLQPGTTVVDVRTPPAYALYHVPGAVNVPGATPEALEAYMPAGAVLVVAGSDAEGRRLAESLRGLDPNGRAHYLTGGARAWYLALELPVPLFSEAPAPYGYREALTAFKAALAAGDADARRAGIAAAETLARLAYQPSLLRSGPRRPAGPSGRRISGGCG